MQTTILGRTGLHVTRSGFGALPIQRLTKDEAVALLRQARQGGITFYDTARAYTDSEEKLGMAFGDNWGGLILATKTGAKDAATLREHLETSLRTLRKEVIDIYQLHNPATVPGEDSELYQALKEAQKAGKIRYIGITNHKLNNALEAAHSGLYDTIQYPLSCLSGDEELAFAAECKSLNLGVIAMKAMAGGLLPSASLSMAYLRHLDNVVPIWGLQRSEELEEVISLEQNPPTMDAQMTARIDEQRSGLTGNFCRGCGYCLPCPAEIPLNTVARLPQLLRRSPWKERYNQSFTEQMLRVEKCLHCGQCKQRCPYGLDTESLIVEALADWRQFGKEHGIEVP